MTHQGPTTKDEGRTDTDDAPVTEQDWTSVQSDLADEKTFVAAVEAALLDEYAELADL